MKLANQKGDVSKVLEDNVDSVYTQQYLYKLRVELRNKTSKNNIQRVFVMKGT